MPRYRLTDKTPLTERIAAFTFTPLDAPLPDWQAGAHIDIELAEKSVRSYSLIEWPGQSREALHIAVQREDTGDGGSRAMHALATGAEITLSDPANSFALADDPGPVALMAGGIGVTPLISMATGLLARKTPFVFHYAGRSAASMAYLDELKTAFGDALHCHYDDTAPLDIAATCAGLGNHRFYICGPKGMIDATRDAAETAGVTAERIHVELFTKPTATKESAGESFEVEINDGRVFTVAPGQSIIDALEAEGVDLVHDCRRGDCGICQTGVKSGIPDHRDVVLSKDERESGKVMQICVSRAKSARLVLDI